MGGRRVRAVASWRSNLGRPALRRSAAGADWSRWAAGTPGKGEAAWRARGLELRSLWGWQCEGPRSEGGRCLCAHSGAQPHPPLCVLSAMGSPGSVRVLAPVASPTHAGLLGCTSPLPARRQSRSSGPTAGHSVTPPQGQRVEAGWAARGWRAAVPGTHALPLQVAEMRRTLTPANSPVSSPSKHGDRFIPSRAGANWSVNFHRINENEKSPSQNRKAKDATSDNGKDGLAYSALLKNELLGAGIEKVQDPQTEDRRLQPSTPEKKSLFTYSLSTKRSSPDDGNEVSPYSLSPVSNKSQKLLRSPRKPTRKISKIPFKVLDAPELQDDFYLNLVDWSSLNVLSVGLGTCVYLWSACTSQVTRLCDLSVEGDSVTSVGWSERGNLVAVGTHKGFVQIWDAAAGKKLSMLEGHTARVGALAWNADHLSSGSRDRMILQRDIRTPPLQSERRLQGHRQEVCGLKWSTDHQLLASGGNDNKLLVWNHSSLSPVQQYTEHLAAVKAIAWSPHQHGLLASGGGTADRCIRFWNTLTGQPLQCIDTGSQVCNLAWSKHANELVSTHGYSQNQILVWKYPSLTQVAKLTGHSYRVLYLAMSPDGEAIVTGAGDETLRFWNVFSKTRSTKESVSVLNLFTRIR
ncbi:fizzy-related protein homolog isoform X2 [Trichechus manatus latirostris]|uniref:Fizzy-related protein homolog n=1 Tax=Trichechus manatus latirostris TaxID=127582 RepID=A0A2Y9R3I2_TRIMA|nr:fizzy-related protein homolog isoform X2 [Trichechus manatus latirostris]